MRSILLVAMLTLAGCCTDQVNVTSCPPLTTVSPEMRARLSAELKLESSDSAIAWMSQDWLKTRDAIRACIASVK